MGTPDFAAVSLNALLNSKHEVVAVYTQPDKPRNRGKKISFSPVKELALERGIPVEQPTTLKDGEALEALRGYNPDCIAVAAYGMILPQSILDLPKYGCINVHGSLLPKYRGAAPINRCIMEGQSESGITIMQMEAGLDTGAMLLHEKVDIPETMTATELHDTLAELGGRLIVQALNDIDTLVPIKQSDSEATYAAKLTKGECELDLSKPVSEVLNKIRGLADYPCAFTYHEGVRLKIYRAVQESGRVIFTEVQPEGGKRMSMEAFLRGRGHKS